MFPHQLYRKTKQWHEPTIWGGKKVLSPAHNEMCRLPHAKLMAAENGNIASRVMVLANPMEKMGYFTLFDTVQNEEAVRCLMREALSWWKKQGVQKVIGPIAPTPVDLGGGILCEGFDEAPAFQDGWNFPYYAEYLEACGFVTESEWLAYRMNRNRFNREKYRRAAEWVSKRFDCTVRNDLLRTPRIYADAICEIMDGEIDSEAASRLVHRLLPHAAEGLCPVVYVQEKPAAFLLTVRKKGERARIVTMWVRKPWRRMGLTAVLFDAVADHMERRNEYEMDASQVNADNAASRMSIEAAGGRIIHRYKICESEI